MKTSKRAAQNFWIEHGDTFTAATWYWPRDGRAAATAVLIVPGVGHEERTMAGGIALLGESLARAGLAALTLDLHGSGQSGGGLDAPAIGERWRADLRAVVAHLRETGFAEIVVVGLRLGALLAAEALQREPLAGLVAWAPVVSGRRHLRELRLMQTAGRTDAAPLGAIGIAGFDLPGTLLEHVGGLDLTRLEALASRRVLVFDAPARVLDGWLDGLRARGAVVDQRAPRQTETWLSGRAAGPALPFDDVATLVDWCSALQAASWPSALPAPTRPTSQRAVIHLHRGQRIRERWIEVGALGLTAVLSEPVGRAQGAVRLMASTVGPGRRFTDFARDEAARGHIGLRLDFAGFGSSPRGTSPAGGELYSDAGRRDVLAALEHLRHSGYERVLLLGYCAGGWSMIQAGPATGVVGVAALNVALYFQPPASAAPAGERALIALAAAFPARWRARLVDKLARRSRSRREPIAWLQRLDRADVPVLLAYADQDPSLPYLRRQLDATRHDGFSERVSIEVYPGLGHLLDDAWARDRLFRDVADWFEAVDASVALPGRAAPSAETVPMRLSTVFGGFGTSTLNGAL